jgi:hypothetical protein
MHRLFGNARKKRPIWETGQLFLNGGSISQFTLCNHHPRQDIGITLQTTSVLASKNIFQTNIGQTISSLLFESNSPQKYGKQVQHNLNRSDMSPRSEKIPLLRCRIISLSTTFCIFNSPLLSITHRLQFLHSSYHILAARRPLLLGLQTQPLRLVIAAPIYNIMTQSIASTYVLILPEIQILVQ